MSNDVFPVLPGQTLEVDRNPVPPPVTIRTTPSRREYRARDATITLYEYKVKYEFLRSSPSYPEMQALVGFFNKHGAQFDSWLFTDPDDNTATNEPFAIGDGSTTVYQLIRGFGGFAEPITALGGTIVIFGNGVPLNLLANGAALNLPSWTTTGTVTPNTTPDPTSGTVDADTFGDTSATVNQSIAQTVSITGDAVAYTASCYVMKTSGGISKTVALQLQLQGGVPLTFTACLNTDNGAVLQSTAGAVVVVVDAGTFWRLAITAQDNGTGNNSATWQCFAAYAAHGSSTADSTQTGNAVLYGCALTVSSSLKGYTSRWYTVSPTTGVVSIAPAPVVGQALTWSGSFYRRCRFSDPKLTLSKFMNQLFSSSGVSFQSTLDQA